MPLQTRTGAKICVQRAPDEAVKAICERDAAECYCWSEQMEGYGGPAQPSPTIAQCLTGGHGRLEVKCHRCKKQVSIPLANVLRPRSTEIWKLESAFRCRSRATKRYSPPEHLIKLTKKREGSWRFGITRQRMMGVEFDPALL